MQKPSVCALNESFASVLPPHAEPCCTCQYSICVLNSEMRYYTSCNHPLREAPRGIRATWCISSPLYIHCLNRLASQSSAAQIKARLSAWQSQFQPKALNTCEISLRLSVCFRTAVPEGGNLPSLFPVHLTHTIAIKKKIFYFLTILTPSVELDTFLLSFLYLAFVLWKPGVGFEELSHYICNACMYFTWCWWHPQRRPQRSTQRMKGLGRFFYFSLGNQWGY